jgi:DNA topoisomerase VI subunit B
VRVFEGHAFIVEAAVSVGGRELKPGINVYRFANRIPLLFEGGSDVITRTATKRINWGAYKINQSSDKVRVQPAAGEEEREGGSSLFAV